MEVFNINKSIHEIKASEKNFGFTFSVFFLVVSFICFRRGLSSYFVSFLTLSIAFSCTALFIPYLLKPLNQLWHKVGVVLSKIVNPLVLGLVYFLVLVPIAMYMRVMKKGAIKIAFQKEHHSYWTKLSRKPASTNFTEQF